MATISYNLESRLCYNLFLYGKAKLANKPDAAALKLMECVFSTEELVNSNPSGVTKSRDPMRQQTIKMLEPRKMKFINGELHMSIINVTPSECRNFC